MYANYSQLNPFPLNKQNIVLIYTILNSLEGHRMQHIGWGWTLRVPYQFKTENETPVPKVLMMSFISTTLKLFPQDLITYNLSILLH